MKAYDPDGNLRQLCIRSQDKLIYLSAILDTLCHISEQLENKQTVEDCKCSNVGPGAIEPDMPVYGDGTCTYCGKFAKRDYGTKSES